MRLSIIIPVYNVEKYIRNCLDSIVGQPLPARDYEIIIINDGSPDNSSKIIREFAEKHSNIISIDQENQGVSAARNRGLDIAKGNYITLIDPDDAIFPNTLQAMLENAERKNLDIQYMNIHEFDEEGNFLKIMPPCGDETIISTGISHPRRTFPATMYKKSLIGSIRFTKNIITGEDTVFNASVQSMAEKVSYYAMPYYKYTIRLSSSRQFVRTEKNFVSGLLALETLNKFRSEHFPAPTVGQQQYFDKVLLLFIQRILEWNVFPTSDKTYFDRLKLWLKDNNLGYLIHATSANFTMFDKPFPVFMAYRKIKGILDAVAWKLKR
jgi:glycosyltransferase involved in cell wall biosynthesis